MRKTVSLAILLVVAFTGVATAEAPTHHGVAGPAKQGCKAERTSDGEAFKTKYANDSGKRAFRRCVKQHLRSAVKACRAERKTDKAAFKTKYANDNGKHAAKRCVNQHSGDAIPSPEGSGS